MTRRGGARDVEVMVTCRVEAESRDKKMRGYVTSGGLGALKRHLAHWAKRQGPGFETGLS